MVAVLLIGWDTSNKYSLISFSRYLLVTMTAEILLLLYFRFSSSFYSLAFALEHLGVVISPAVSILMIVPAYSISLVGMIDTGRVPWDLLEAESELITGISNECSAADFSFSFSWVPYDTHTRCPRFRIGTHGKQILLDTLFFSFDRPFLSQRAYLPRLRWDSLLESLWLFFAWVILIFSMISASSRI